MLKWASKQCGEAVAAKKAEETERAIKEATGKFTNQSSQDVFGLTLSCLDFEQVSFVTMCVHRWHRRARRGDIIVNHDFRSQSFSIAETFASMDTDNNGVIDLEEWTAAQLALTVDDIAEGELGHVECEKKNVEKNCTMELMPGLPVTEANDAYVNVYVDSIDEAACEYSSIHQM